MADPETLAAQAAVDDEEAAFLASLKSKPGKKKKKKKKVAEEGEEAEEATDVPKFLNGDSQYTYDTLLSRVFAQVKAKNPEVKKFTLKPPNVVRAGSKKSAFTNFSEICRSLNRAPEHFSAFVTTELATTADVDGNNCLILNGRFQFKHLDPVLRRYIQEYVACAMCHSLDTILIKDPSTRLTQMECKACKAARTVTAIHGGLQVGKAVRSVRRANK